MIDRTLRSARVLGLISLAAAFAGPAAAQELASDNASAAVFGGAQIVSSQQASGAATLAGGPLIAAVGPQALQGASANLGINLATGADNVQSNELAVVASAQPLSIQTSQDTHLVVHARAPLQAELGAGALADLSGNVGANLAAGAGNLQHNGLLVR